MQKIFLSYSRKDMEFARKLAGDLEKAGYDVWWDITDLRGGEDWVKKIPAAIEDAQHFIVVLTPNSIKSEWVQKEYTQALNLQKKILPIMLEQCPVPFALNTINFVNFVVGEYPKNFKDLLSALGYEGKPPVVTPYERAKSILPPSLRKFTAPILIGIAALLAVLLLTVFKPDEPIVITPTADFVDTITATAIVKATGSSQDTPSATMTNTVTVTSTAILTPTQLLTPTVTNQPFDTLTYCSNSWQSSTINVRSGPGTNYAVLGEPLPLRRCLTFHAVNEGQTWLLIAPDQDDPRHVQYEGGWIFRELLGLGLVGSIDLPVVTLTFTPTASLTPAPSNTPTSTPSPTTTFTETPSPTETFTDTPEPTSTP